MSRLIRQKSKRPHHLLSGGLRDPAHRHTGKGPGVRRLVPRDRRDIALNAEGHRGVNVIRPHTGSRTYTIVLHFDALEHLEQWLASEVWNVLIL